MKARPSRSSSAGTVVCDLDGVVYLGNEGIAGAGTALKMLEEAGFRLVFATNNSPTTQTSVIEKVSRLTGYLGSPLNVVTSGMAAAGYLARRYERVHVIGETALKETIEAAHLTITDSQIAVDAVVIGIDFNFSYDKLDAAIRAIRNGAAFIATNTDATYPTDTGQAPGAGSLVAAVQAGSGVAPLVCGKPHQPMIDLLSVLCVGGPTWMVGDRPETDIALAAAAGWQSILTLSGVTSSSDDIAEGLKPDYIVADIAEVPAVVFAAR